MFQSTRPARGATALTVSIMRPLWEGSQGLISARPRRRMMLVEDYIYGAPCNGWELYPCQPDAARFDDGFYGYYSSEAHGEFHRPRSKGGALFVHPGFAGEQWSDLRSGGVRKSTLDSTGRVCYKWLRHNPLPQLHQDPATQRGLVRAFTNVEPNPSRAVLVGHIE